MVALCVSLLCSLRPARWWCRLFWWTLWWQECLDSRPYFGGILCGCCSAGTHYGISFGTTGAWHSARFRSARSGVTVRTRWDLSRREQQQKYPLDPPGNLTVRPWRYTIRKGEDRLPTIIFQGRTVKLREGKFPPQNIHWYDWMSDFLTLKGLWYHEIQVRALAASQMCFHTKKW